MLTTDTLTVVMTTLDTHTLLRQTTTIPVIHIHTTQAMTSRATRLTYTVFMQAKAMLAIHTSLTSAITILSAITLTARITLIIRIHTMITMIINIRVKPTTTVIYTIICTHILLLVLVLPPLLSPCNLTRTVMATSTTMGTRTCMVYICMSWPIRLDRWRW